MESENETQKSMSKRRWPALLFWLIFLAGVALHFLSPNLPIEHDSFVIRGDSAPRGQVIDPRAMVRRQRFFELGAAVLVTVGAAGLVFCYRRVLAESLLRK